MKPKLPLALLFALAVGCGGALQPSAPLTFDQMVEAQSEFLILEAGLSSQSLPKAQKDSLLAAAFRSRLKGLNLDVAQYEASYNVYVSSPELMDSLYAKVLDNLSRKEAGLQN